MTIDPIRLFILTAKHLSITKAARNLRISQSTVSRQLTQFQLDLGINLLEKNGRGIRLTNVGQTYFKEISPIVSELDAAHNKCTRREESVTIAGSHRPSKYLLPAMMTEFSQKHPSAKLTLLTRSSVAMEKLLLDSKVDLAITTNATPSLASFVTEPYCREPLTAFVAANHPLARMNLLRPEEMGTIPVIIKVRREGESRVEAQLRKLEQGGIKFKTVVRCDSPEVVKEFVRYRAGVGFLYYNSIKRGVDHGEFKAIQFPGLELTGQNYIVYSKEKPLSSIAREFLLLLRASVTKTPPTKAMVAQNSRERSNGVMRDHILRSKLLY